MAQTLPQREVYREPGAGDFEFTNDDFNRIATLLQRESGIHLQKSKASLVYSRLAKRLRALQIESFNEYCKLVAADAEERMNMLAALTTNVTRFFREPHHFEHLKTPRAAALARRGAQGRRRCGCGRRDVRAGRSLIRSP